MHNHLLSHDSHKNNSKSPLSSRVSGIVTLSTALILGGCAVDSRVDIQTATNRTKTSATTSGKITPLSFDSILWKWEKESRYKNIFWQQNLTFLSSNEIEVLYPTGSYSPKNSTIKGGAEFIYRLENSTDIATLTYQIRFEPGFDFRKGGKLPGLCSDSCPSGWADVSDGFSARLMWRKNGDGEVYLYIPGKIEKYGQSMGRGKFRFIPGQYHTISETIHLNTSGNSDWSLKLEFDGKEVISENGIVFRTTQTKKINSLFFSTFFGGNDASWATYKDQKVRFRGFSVQY